MRYEFGNITATDAVERRSRLSNPPAELRDGEHDAFGNGSVICLPTYGAPIFDQEPG
jgi:hypothetical protein